MNYIVRHFSNYNPSSSFKFPKNIVYGKHCLFQYRYLECYKWLGYSVKLDACLCLSCSLFGEARDAQNFVRKPVAKWKTFNNMVKAHSTSSTHIKCVSVMVSFIEVKSGNQPKINTTLISHRQELYHHNSERFDAITDIIIL